MRVWKVKPVGVYNKVFEGLKIGQQIPDSRYCGFKKKDGYGSYVLMETNTETVNCLSSLFAMTQKRKTWVERLERHSCPQLTSTMKTFILVSIISPLDISATFISLLTSWSPVDCPMRTLELWLTWVRCYHLVWHLC